MSGKSTKTPPNQLEAGQIVLARTGLLCELERGGGIIADLRKRVQVSSNGVISFLVGSLSPAVDHLVEQGLVTSSSLGKMGRFVELAEGGASELRFIHHALGSLLGMETAGIRGARVLEDSIMFSRVAVLLLLQRDAQFVAEISGKIHGLTDGLIDLGDSGATYSALSTLDTKGLLHYLGRQPRPEKKAAEKVELSAGGQEEAARVAAGLAGLLGKHLDQSPTELGKLVASAERIPAFSKVEAVILFLLIQHGSMAEVQMMSRSEGYIIRSTFTETLRKMEEKGFITAYAPSGQEKRYQVPELIKAKFEVWLSIDSVSAES